MKKIAIVLTALLWFTAVDAQKSAAEDSDFSFETKRDDGNKKFIKYTAINAGYTSVLYEVDDAFKFSSVQTQGYTVTWEAYNTYSKKIAGSSQVRGTYFNNSDFMVAFDYGLYFILFKGLYLKVQGGYGVLSNSSTGLAPYVGTYGGDLGYLFKLKTSEGRRAVYLSIYGGYHAFAGSETDYNSSLYGYLNTYSAAGPAAGIKIMWGPKPSSDY